jgi:hypothetical protein
VDQCKTQRRRTQLGSQKIHRQVLVAFLIHNRAKKGLSVCQQDTANEWQREHLMSRDGGKSDREDNLCFCCGPRVPRVASCSQLFPFGCSSAPLREPLTT